MNDKKIKEILQRLQAIQPDSHLLHTIQKEVEKEISPKRFGIKSLFPFPLSVPITLIAFALLFYFAVTLIFSNSISDMLVQAKIALAPTQYDKAKIAYGYADKKFTQMKNDSFNANDIPEVSHSIELANAAMIGLKLKGEKGKYTMQQCLALYTIYHARLETMEKELGPSKDYSLLKTEIEEYDVQAEKKLHSYNK